MRAEIKRLRYELGDAVRHVSVVRYDAFNGHTTTALGYHYHASLKYPFINGGFHGEVVERDGQVDPQPRAGGVREALQQLRGARITGFTWGIRTFTQSPYVFTTVNRARDFVGRDRDHITYVLVSVEPGASRDQVIAELEQARMDGSLDRLQGEHSYSPDFDEARGMDVQYSNHQAEADVTVGMSADTSTQVQFAAPAAGGGLQLAGHNTVAPNDPLVDQYRRKLSMALF